MITLEQFIWLIHYALLALYGWEIALFAYNRVKQPAAFKQIGSLQQHWDAMGTGALGLVALHSLFYGMYTKAVPIVLIVYAGVSIYCGVQNEAVKPFLRKLKGQAAPSAHTGRAAIIRDKLISAACSGAVFIGMVFLLQGTNHPPAQLYAFGAIATFWLVDFLLKRRREAAAKTAAQEQRSSHNSDGANDDPDFSFKQDRWEKASSWTDAGGSSNYNAEADYQNALTEAQKWADQASSRENATNWAAKFEKLAGNPALHPKDKLRYRLAAMLLRERLKGQGKAAASGAREPTDADLTRLGLPVPKNGGSR